MVVLFKREKHHFLFPDTAGLGLLCVAFMLELVPVLKGAEQGQLRGA